ncbi:MAG: prepilin-type N-terminal cleavage/methylation domain-containing protein [Candidatus Levybacteria bacterium]|nr:prepilin-type N-terminal cleavage/methylation domain-containing protein [Candidatus Levybacteria bacterium]
MKIKLNKGFTLIEMIVVFGIIGVIVVSLMGSIKPLEQLNKGKDTQRLSDLAQIKTALDIYYNDQSKYPPSLTFGAEWKVNSTIYMKKVPKDPNGSSSYVYYIDELNPQWAVIFAKLSKPTNSCALTSLPNNCLPDNYNSNWLCVLLGDVDCTIIKSKSLP